MASSLGRRARSLGASVPRTRRGIAELAGLVGRLGALGWRRSADAVSPVGVDGEPIPWFTYPAIAWLDLRIAPTDRVLEFGSGSSTTWLAARAGEVTAVEHIPSWARRVRQQVPSNVRVLEVPGPERSEGVPSDHPYLEPLRTAEDGSLDVVVVDGRARTTALELCPTKVAPDGIVVLDNAERAAYWPALDRLRQDGWSRIDFFGPVPGSGRLNVTSVLFRDGRRWLQAPVDPPGPVEATAGL